MSKARLVEDKVVVVTGAGGGIGRDIALAMAREGAKVVVNDIGASVSGEGQDAGPAQKVVDEIKAMGGQAAANTDSVADPAGAARIVQTAIDSFGRIDVVVNNAGILRDRFFHKMSADEWDTVLKVHLYGAFYVSRAAAPHFKEQESGNYIHMTSTSGLVGNFGQANYSAAKLGVTALSKSIALDMQKFKVRSNCISPFAWSRMIGSIPTETPEEQARVERIKQMTPAKIAPMAVALASDAIEYVREKPSPRLADVDLADLVDEVGIALQEQGEDKDPNLLRSWVNEIGAGGMARCDRDLLYRVFVNLGRNAFEAGATSVTIRTRRSSGFLLVEIADNGPGVPAAVARQLFRPFTTGGRQGGTGLGLAIARDLVRLHGGDITLIESNAQGTLFGFTLPIA